MANSNPIDFLTKTILENETIFKQLSSEECREALKKTLEVFETQVESKGMLQQTLEVAEQLSKIGQQETEPIEPSKTQNTAASGTLGSFLSAQARRQASDAARQCYKQKLLFMVERDLNDTSKQTKVLSKDKTEVTFVIEILRDGLEALDHLPTDGFIYESIKAHYEPLGYKFDDWRLSMGKFTMSW